MSGKGHRLLWVMLDKKPNGIPFRFVRLLPRIFGVEIIAVWTVKDYPEPREGLLMVNDWNGRYRGCIGEEAWDDLVRRDRLRALGKDK